MFDFIRKIASLKAVRLLAVAVGSWRFWAASAFAAGVVATVVIYTDFFASSDEVGSYPYYRLVSNEGQTASSNPNPSARILLMNSDRNTDCFVDCDNFNGTTTGTKTNRDWWEFLDDSTVSLYNLVKGNHFKLHGKGNDGQTLWEAFYCRGGNLNSTTIPTTQNCLPYSSTSYGFRGRTLKATIATAGTLVMQNTPDARVVSSCYPEGIGTVYFDAVNGFTGYKKGELAVEVAYGVFKTNTTGQVASRNIPDDLELERDAEGNEIPGRYVAPDAEHCDEIHVITWTAESGVELAETNAYGRCAWVRANLTGRYFGNDTGVVATNNTLKLELPLSGSAGSMNNFYRIWAPVQDARINPALAAHCRGPMRFQITRLDDPSVIGTRGMDLDGGNLGNKANNGLIILDNIIASYPAMKATAVPQGEYVAGGSIRNVIGWAGAFSSKYPYAGETGITAEAGFSFMTNTPPDSTISDAWIASTKATMKYRWRYLATTNGWSEIPMAADGDRLVSIGAINMPEDVGDLEFYYDTELDAPYYGYVDYSGKNFGTPGYIERIKHVEGRLDPSVIGPGGLPSTGTDFFTRLREGRSDQLEFRLQLRWLQNGAYVVTNQPFHLTAALTWKAFVRTTTNETSRTAFRAGDYEFRVVGVNPSQCFGGLPVTSLPWSGKRLFRTDDDEGGWTKITLDAVTGALMFQVMEDEAFADEMTYTVVHASYQDFNRWSDAESADTYVGAYSETRGRQSGSSPDTREYPSELPTWSAMPGINTTYYWNESFALISPNTPEQGYNGIPAYEEFPRCLTPRGWLAQNAQWTCARWRESSAGGDMALQLGGAARGTLSFTNTKEKPHGVDRVTLKARVAQAAKFEDFAYYLGDPLESMKDYVFTSRAIMYTTDASTKFDGNGSVSLVGYYQPGEGCYELRAERIADNTVRISLYKWEYDLFEDAVLPRFIARHASTRAMNSESYFRCNNAANTTTLESQGYFGELFIRCRTQGTSTIIEAGIMNAAKKLTESCSNVSHYYLKYTDTDHPLTFGTFGFGSLSCPAKFIAPQRYTAGTSGTFPNVTTKTYGPTGAQLSNPTCGNANVVYPTTGNIDDVFQNSASGTKYLNWAFKSNRFSLATLNTTYKAVEAVPPSGELVVSVTDDSGAEFSSVTNTVSGFTYSTNCVFQVRNTEDSLLRITTGKKSGDIVVDDVSFGQWCAASYNDSDNEDFYDRIPTQGCPDYFVYLNGWVSVVRDLHSIALQPARVRAGEIASIRAPLMDGYDGRGIGLGMFSYTYRNADSNCVVIVQYRELNGSSGLRNATAEIDGWTDVATNDFSQIENRASGTISTYVGKHGVQGVMRLVIAPKVVADSQNPAKNPGRDPAYGSIEIVDFLSRDEPKVDDTCWWGWNLRTTDQVTERSLYDGDPTAVGMALGLNNSVTENIESEYADLYPQKLPFVQTPTFATNVVGELSFRARRLPGEEGNTEVAILGAKDGAVLFEDQWVWLDTVVISSDSYRQYTYKTKDGDDYAAFRLAVIGVSGVDNNRSDKMLIPSARRVLIDEVAVSEAVRGKLAFRDVGAFRSHLEQNTPIADVTGRLEQPLVKESWGVQGEVYIAQMEEEIDTARGFQVKLHWFRGQEPWGFENWRGLGAAQSAWLTRATGTSAWIYRSNYIDCPAAVILPSMTNEVVQYMLEVQYYTPGAENPSTNFLSAADWTMPEWYHPVDFNAGRDFAAYTILDTVAPGWAWVNEINFFGRYNSLWENSDDSRQYVEVAMPREADLTGWTLRFLDANIQSGQITTNTVAKFGYNIGSGLIPATKTKNAASNCVFMVVASQLAKRAGSLNADDGEVDGYWLLSNRGTSAFGSEHQIVANYPVGVQLVRPSGVIEHELLMIGTNFWEGTVLDDFHPEEYVEFYNSREPGGKFFFAGREHGGDPCSLGVFRGCGATEADWNNSMVRTPGRINERQEIDPVHPTPFGSSVLVYLNIGRHIAQTVSGETTRENQIAVVRKGDEFGLNIEYTVDRWYELGSVTTNYAPAVFTPSGERRYRLTVARNCSNDTLTVDAAAAISQTLIDDYGLTEDNRYREAVMSWLERGTDINGNAWVDDGSDELKLAEFWSYGGSYVTNINLTTMYWLDIPPTEGNWVLRGGMSEPPTGEFPDPNNSSMTNLRMSVYMMISNKLEAADWLVNSPHRMAHPPYCLRGLEPDSSSIGYDPDVISSKQWNGVTFKITGFMWNGKTDFKNRENHVPLRWFVFNNGSFYPRGHAKEFQSVVDIRYPYTKESPAMAYGMREWLQAHKGEPYPMFTYFWSLDERLQPLTVEVLRPDSRY